MSGNRAETDGSLDAVPTLSKTGDGTLPRLEIAVPHDNKGSSPGEDVVVVDKVDLLSPLDESPTEAFPRVDLPLLPSSSSSEPTAPKPHVRLYKRRFFPLVQLALLNLVVSWAWLTFSASSGTSAAYFQVSETAINWLSTGYMFAFVAASPVTLWALGRGPKFSMLVCASLLLVGVWLRHLGAKVRQEDGGIFGLVMLGQVMTGLAQPFVLAAPTRLSDLWFTEGRIAATAVTTLANPLGGAVAQLVGPLIATETSKVPSLTLWTAVITTIVCVPTLLVPARPPTPVTTSSASGSGSADGDIEQHSRGAWHEESGSPPTPLPPSLDPDSSLASPPPRITVPYVLTSVRTAFRVPAIHLIFWAFVSFVCAFNATSSLLNQILGPYGYSEDEAGIDGALLILVGLGCSAITSPLLDRFPRWRIPTIKLCVLLLAGGYVGLIFAPRAGLEGRTGSARVGPPFAISAILGSASFTVLPLALEVMVDLCSPVGPEVTSTLAWAIGQLGGGSLILAMDHLTGGKEGEPEKSMYRGLVLQAVLACVVAPFPMLLGWRGLGTRTRQHG